jgi:hypothetical protein
MSTMKRIRKVFPTSEIPHLWFHQTQSDARSQGNVFFNGDTIYSYGEHFPIARHVTNKSGQRAVLFTIAHYSVTTTGHCSAVRSAIPSGTVVFDVPSLGTHYASGTPSHNDNLKYFVTQINEHVTKASRARSTWAITSHLGQANGLVESAKAYGKFFRVRVPKLPAVPEADSEKLAAIGKREREESARKAKEQREENERRKQRIEQERKEWEEKLPTLCAEWRNGANVHIPRPNYTWYDYDKVPSIPTMLRISGDEVETSLGARVPVSHAKRGLAFVRRVMASGQEYVRNGHTLHLGHYAIDKIETDGTLHAGCHVIKFSEIENLAPALDAVIVTASESEASNV